MRIVHCEDAITWLKNSPMLEGSSIVGSLPDISEFPELSLKEWKEWFIMTSKLILSRCPDDGVTIFFQSDIKVDGVWVDKGFLCQKAAEDLGHELLWHKIACRFPAGTTTFGRPAYTHLLCFSKGVRPDLGKSSADVLPEMGDKAWERGMGTQAALSIAKFIFDNTQTRTVVNPFCGVGSMLAAANFFGLDAVGIERSPKRAQKARSIKLSEDKKWIIEGSYPP